MPASYKRTLARAIIVLSAALLSATAFSEAVLPSPRLKADTSLPGSSLPDRATPNNYLLGRGISDITGPALGIQMWGFGFDGQVTEGIHIRQKSRAFVIAEMAGDKRLVFVSADIGSIEHNITLEVIERLQRLYGELYSLDNVILSATHTHAAPGGYWHNRVEGSAAGEFYQQHFDHIVAGIVASIRTAHDDLQPGNIHINSGDVEGAGINRSLIAYEQNPAQERARHKHTIDKKMTLLKLTTGAGDIGMINWYAVHPTSMTYYNRLISGDNKGYASLAFERIKNTPNPVNGDGDAASESESENNSFVAAFAQANPGDVTPNLNLNNTGPGVDDVDSTKIIGERQLDVALELFDNAAENLEGKLDYRQLYVDLSNYEVDEPFTQAGTQSTCPSAYGYSFAGGSGEDGGGHFLFKEGMTDQKFYLDFLIKLLTGMPSPSDDLRACQLPKPILWAAGEGAPPPQSQIRSISVIRIGQLVILALPAEVTTMAGRRLRDTVMSHLGDWAKHIVIAGYSNGYAGYVTTPEEYRIQQYEGGHTLHGQWSLPAYQQISAQLATALESDTAIAPSIAYDDWRGKSVSTPLNDAASDKLPAGQSFGQAQPLDKTHFKAGDTVTASFWSSNPTNNFDTKQHYLAIEQRQDDAWVAILNDHDWSTTVRWVEADGGYRAEVKWDIAGTVAAGDYRIRHFGQYIDAQGVRESFVGSSESLTVE